MRSTGSVMHTPHSGVGPSPEEQTGNVVQSVLTADTVEKVAFLDF